MKIGARIVRHGRYVVFQLAEVALPRALFAGILRGSMTCGNGLRLPSSCGGSPPEPVAALTPPVLSGTHGLP